MTPLYSHNNARPAPLPFRITLPSGFTRTDPSTFTADEITAAGYAGPYPEPPYDAAAEQLDWIDGAYVISPLPPAPPPLPEPRWQEFAAALMADPGVNAMLSQAMTVAPALYGGLIVGMGQAAQGDPATFATAWGQATAAGLISVELASGIAVMAAAYDIPSALGDIIAPQQSPPKPSGWNPPASPGRGDTYQAPDGSWWKWDQPRNAQTGQFLADDPATPEAESALGWQPATSPS